MRALSIALIAFALVFATSCQKQRLVVVPDAGPLCDSPQRLINGTCQIICSRNGDCDSTQRCNLFTGQCEAKPPPTDGGPPPTPCTGGAERCALDNKSVERCDADGGWGLETSCPQPDGFCENERCLACRPGATRCVSSGAAVEICREDGSGFRSVTCAPGASCTAGQCGECTVGDKRCRPDLKTVQECQRLPREDLSAGWVNVGDNFDGLCITQVCETPTTGPQCRPPSCVPGSSQCLNATTQQVCSATGGYTNVVCSTQPGMGPNAECVNGLCIDECSDAARANSYFGCDYWTTVMDNVVTPAVFKGNTTVGQGTVDSEFAFVVSNRSTNPATVTVTRWMGAAAQTVKTVPLPGRNDPATHGLAIIKVPWHALANDPNGLGVTGQARYAYRLTTTKPVTVYQFNPLSAVGLLGSCSSAGQCTAQPPQLNPTCVMSVCNYYAYSNDASLLLPAHILGTAYVGLTPEHVISRTSTTSGAPANAFNATLTIVGTQDNTQVTVKATARTRAGGGVAALNPGDVHVYTVNSYDVLQLSTDMPSNVVSGSTAGNLECGDDPYDGSFNCVFGGSCDKLCRVLSDLTGTVITSTAPVAVFGGSSCTLRGYRDTACDHVEEELFPFVTWGQDFVATRTAPLRLTDNSFASAANAGPDYYKIVAGCPDSQCPNGTTLTLSTAPAAADVLVGSNGCEPTTSLTANTCRLRGGKFVEFRSRASFRIQADKPIQVGQLFAGQNATTGTTRPAQGDPSLVLLPPVEQWRASYTVLTAPGTRDNYLGIVVDDARVASVQVDGVAVAAGWNGIGGTTFRSVNVPVATGTHTVQVVARTGQTSVPGGGITVYGFDNYVSYGYTGGLDFGSIVTGINPGG